MTVEQASRPLDISCAHLSLIKYQLATRGEVTIGNNRPQIRARVAILEEIAGNKIRFVEEPTNFTQEIPEISDPIHQRRITMVRTVAQTAKCWWVQAGCMAVDDQGNVVAEGNSNPLLGESECSGLAMNPQDAMSLLEPGERLLFCSGVHDVENMVTDAARGNGGLGHKTHYLSLEPCDRCASILTRLEPKAVYFSLGIGRKKYYNSLGLEFLQLANIPTFFVRMPEE